MAFLAEGVVVEAKLDKGRGPVATVLTFNDADEAAMIANDTAFGLASGLWTNDLKKAHTFARRIKAGTVWINTYNMTDNALPFGGYKESGFGREGGLHGLMSYLSLE